MSFCLLIAVQLLQFCLANCITDVHWPQNIIGNYHILMKRQLAQAMTKVEADEVALMAVEPSSTITAQQSNSMIHLTGFRGSSIELTSKTVPASYMSISAENTAIEAQDDGNYVLHDKKHSNEISKRRVVKMAVAPSYAPTTPITSAKENAPTIPYTAPEESEVSGQGSKGADHYSVKQKHR